MTVQAGESQQVVRISVAPADRPSEMGDTVALLHLDEAGDEASHIVLIEHKRAPAILDRLRSGPLAESVRASLWSIAALWDLPVETLDVPRALQTTLRRRRIDSLGQLLSLRNEVEHRQTRMRPDLYAELEAVLSAFDVSAPWGEIETRLRAELAETLGRVAERTADAGAEQDEEEDASDYWQPPAELDAVRQQILTFGGQPALTSHQAARYLGLSTRQGLSRRRHAGKLLGLPVGPRRFLYPRWQFEPSQPDQLLFGLPDFLAAVGSDPWGLADVLTTRQPHLGDMEPVKLLRDRNRRAEAHSKVSAMLAETYESGRPSDADVTSPTSAVAAHAKPSGDRVEKQARAATRGSSKKQHVVPVAGGWAVRGEGNATVTSRYPTQREAEAAARQIAKRRDAEVIVHRADGTISAGVSNQKRSGGRKRSGRAVDG